jgi:hypothetical protein
MLAVQLSKLEGNFHLTPVIYKYLAAAGHTQSYIRHIEHAVLLTDPTPTPDAFQLEFMKIGKAMFLGPFV